LKATVLVVRPEHFTILLIDWAAELVWSVANQVAGFGGVMVLKSFQVAHFPHHNDIRFWRRWILAPRQNPRVGHHFALSIIDLSAC